MSATAVQTERAEKYLVRNNTAGYVGVIEIHPRTGEESGINIEPFGTRWMTEEEMIATARAPRRPEDNPFEEQSYWFQDPETQQRQEQKVRPLTLVQGGERYVPGNDRYVPTQDVPREAVPASAQARAEASPADVPTPQMPSPAPAVPQNTPTPELRRSAGRDPAPVPVGGEQAESWVQPPEAPGKVLGGSLSGSDEPSPEERAAPDPASHPGERYTPPTQGAVQTPGAVEEEHARAVDPEIGEETGQARPPAQEQPQGEYAQAEEVGSPDAPQQTSGNDETLIGG